MRTLLPLTAAIGVLVMTVTPGAHHAFSAEFDESRPVTLKGVITEMEWVNPHSWIHLDVKGPDGKPYKTRAGGVARLSDLIADAIAKAGERTVTDDPSLDRDHD